MISGNILAARPTAAIGVGVSGCSATKQMAALVVASREKEIPALFASGSLWLSPSGAEWQGPEGIAAGMGKAQAMNVGRPKLAHVPFSITGDGRECFIELAIETNPGGPFRIASIIHVTEDGKGKIARAITYLRPKPSIATSPSLN